LFQQLVGCYKETGRQLLKIPGDIHSPATLQVCIDACAVAGFTFAGLQDGTDCYCGDGYSKTTASTCDSPCAGDPSTVCGGATAAGPTYTSSVYTVCPKGFYGTDCLSKCPQCSGDVTCNVRTGACLAAATTTQAPTTPKPICPLEWTSLDDGAGGSYRVICEAKNWEDSFNACKALGANMASITTQQQSDAITTYLKNLAPPKAVCNYHILIGMQRLDPTSCRDDISPMVWKKSDGSHTDLSEDFSNWAFGPLPDCQRNEEHCGEIYMTSQYQSKWNDLDCSFKGCALCQK